MNAKRIRIFDSTLRDGEQSPGASMNGVEKLLVALHLERLGVDVIEAGFPAASEGELQAVRKISQTIRDCQVAALCRTRDEDIRLAWEAIHAACFPLLHTFIATSDLHLENKLRMTRSEVLQEIERAVRVCKGLSPTVEFSAEDASRSDLDFLNEVVVCAAEAGADIINLPDTVGYALPEETARMIGAAKQALGDKSVIISTHCHNDLGLAVANSLAALDAGADQVECCVNGIGERAGNAALEEIVMALCVRSDQLDYTTGIDTSRLYCTSRLVSEITCLPIQPNKAIVGDNAFAHEAGVHQHAILNDRRTYEIMRPEDVGRDESTLVLGKHSGSAAVKNRLSALGYRIDTGQLEQIMNTYKNLADKKKYVYDEDLHALVGSAFSQQVAQLQLEWVEFESGSNKTPCARLQLQFEGNPIFCEGTGDGPVHAVFRAIKHGTGRNTAILRDYQLTAVSEGSDALGKVNLSISESGLVARGQATHTDVVVASAQAFVSALNQLSIQAEINRRVA